MTVLEVTRDSEWCSMFLKGLPPKGITDQQWQALMELASLHARRRQARRNIEPLTTGNTVGGWHITATPSEFERILDIAGAILAKQFGPLAAYRAEPQP